ncbi:hypothetical protein SAMN05192539_101849 [Paraburkholderia diazotrophica]|uniref:Uncharacterized protein n=2 Tax=Paraburkholderia diazotrophica TaxID=667676 RepID=A0A1H7BV86_9BURK|nr:hypothetical protein SAMN05192539_101849 [Paraburkholderia diazotrophica]
MHTNRISSLMHQLLSSASAACAMLLCTAAVAQITAPNGNMPQENRSAPMGSKSDPPPAHMLESSRPQAVDAQKERDATAKPEHKAEGAGGFDNGLYGTGAGSNK